MTVMSKYNYYTFDFELRYTSRSWTALGLMIEWLRHKHNIQLQAPGEEEPEEPDSKYSQQLETISETKSVKNIPYLIPYKEATT